MADLTGGSAAIAGLEPKEARYFKISPDASASSWKVALDVTNGEAMFAIRKDFIPDFLGRASGDVADNGGIYSRLSGDEIYHLLSRDTEESIGAEDYYIAVISEGVDPENSSKYGTGPITANLTSTAPALPIDLGTLGTTEIRRTVPLGTNGIQLLDMVVGANTPAFDIRLENTSGDMYFSALTGTHYPAPAAQGSRDGFDGGWKSQVEGDSAGALADVNGQSVSFTLQAKNEATADVVITPRFKIPVDFNNGTSTIGGQLAGTWRFFEVIVPEGFLGWDARLRDVTSGNPRMVVSKGRFPTELRTSFPGHSNATAWPDAARWSEDDDYSKNRWIPGEGLETQRLISAFGKPLDAGTYFIGVVNDGEDSDAAAYTFESRAIGLEGSGAAIIIQELPFDADPSSIALTVPAGEIAYARCAVPENKKAWASPPWVGSQWVALGGAQGVYPRPPCDRP